MSITLYEVSKQFCATAELPPDTGTVQRFVGTLRTAGFPSSLDSERERKMAMELLARCASRETPRELPQDKDGGEQISKTAAPAEAAVPALGRFDTIDDLRGKSVCPRCKKDMVMVKLSAYEGAKYCSTCRVALWPDD